MNFSGESYIFYVLFISIDNMERTNKENTENLWTNDDFAFNVDFSMYNTSHLLKKGLFSAIKISKR